MAKSNVVSMPFLPLRDMVVFPHMVVPLFIGRPTSLAAIKQALAGDKQIFLLSQQMEEVEEPALEDLYDVGVVATILQTIELPDGTIKVLLEGVERAKISDLVLESGCYQASIKLIKVPNMRSSVRLDQLKQHVITQFEAYVKANKRLPLELVSSVAPLTQPGQLADAIAAHLHTTVELRQGILETVAVDKRLQKLLDVLMLELELSQVDKKIQGRIKDQTDKTQLQYYLNEKMKAIQEELGEIDESASLSEIQSLERDIENAQMSEEAHKKAMDELEKLKMMPAMSAEATVARNYLESLIKFPWQKRNELNKDISNASEVLDNDHYGLEKVKERILEYLAVQSRVDQLNGPIMCLVGPPGVGKTSLGQSIANATGRTFVRISLGGVRDEAEIRGHRRTYIGAMPGKIIQKMTKCGVKNPLFMLDEIDKMAMDFRGDPASALLEVLDPEQNNTFSDHFLEVDCDLSDVMFIATANSMDIPYALLDRMEIIHLSGYTETEKLNIANRYLIPRQLKKNGLKKTEISLTDAVIQKIIRNYTREAGVRGLERQIAKICRKVVKQLLMQKRVKSKKITVKNMEGYLGVERYRWGVVGKKNRVGQVNGLAWTEVGGELLSIETEVLPGKDGQLIRTGNLGEVMLESIQAAMTVVRSRAQSLHIDPETFHKNDFHIHVPEGATPKDGPSAGIGMCTALVSSLTQIPVRSNVAMTGEITLRGEVFAIGGLKEKLLAALGCGIKEVIIPKENARELKEIPKEVTDHMVIHPVQWVDEVLEIALARSPSSPSAKLRPAKKKVASRRSSAGDARGH